MVLVVPVGPDAGVRGRGGTRTERGGGPAGGAPPPGAGPAGGGPAGSGTTGSGIRWTGTTVAPGGVATGGWGRTTGIWAGAGAGAGAAIEGLGCGEAVEGPVDGRDAGRTVGGRLPWCVEGPVGLGDDGVVAGPRTGPRRERRCTSRWSAPPITDPRGAGALAAFGLGTEVTCGSVVSPVVRSLVVRRGAEGAWTARWTVAPGIELPSTLVVAAVIVGAGSAVRVRCGAIGAVAVVASAGRVRGGLRRGVAPADVRRSPDCVSPDCVSPVRVLPGCPVPVRAFGVRVWLLVARAPGAVAPGVDRCTSRLQVAATTGRGAVPAAVVTTGAENPSAAPVFTVRSRPESKVRERWTVGVSAEPPVVAVARPSSRFGPMFRMRTGAGAGGAVLPGVGVPVSVPALVRGRSPSTARCTGEG